MKGIDFPNTVLQVFGREMTFQTHDGSVHVVSDINLKDDGLKGNELLKWLSDFEQTK